MKKNNESFKEIINILKDLNCTFPNQGCAHHIHEATLGYKNLWGLEDKDFLLALKKYKTELDLNIASSSEVNSIIKDGMDLEMYFIEDHEWDNEG